MESPHLHSACGCAKASDLPALLVILPRLSLVVHGGQRHLSDHEVVLLPLARVRPQDELLLGCLLLAIQLLLLQAADRLKRMHVTPLCCATSSPSYLLIQQS